MKLIAIFSLLGSFLLPLSTEAKTSLVIGGLTIHGIAPMNGSNYGMPRRLTNDGIAVYTPSVGLRIGEENLFTGMVLKDCYDNFAGTLLWGRKFYEQDWFSLEWSVGLYVREDTFYQDERNGRTYYAKDLALIIKTGNTQILPWGFVGVELFPKSRISPVISTNLMITNLSFKIDF